MAVTLVAVVKSHHVEECPAGCCWYTVVASVVRGRYSMSRAAVATVVVLCPQ